MNTEAQGALSGAASGAGAGAAFGPWGALIGAGVGAGVGYFEAKNRPKYNISPEYDENKALASAQAFGLNPAVRQGLSQADQDVAEVGNQAQQVSSNTGQILNVISAANKGKMATQRQLAGMGGEFNTEGRRELMGANAAMAEERDKAWNYNLNMPYQNMVGGVNQGLGAGEQNYWKRQDMLQAMKLLGARNNPYGPINNTYTYSSGSPVSLEEANNGAGG